MKKSIRQATAVLLTCTLFGSPSLWLNTPAARAEATAGVHAPVSKEQAVQTARSLANLPESSWKLVNSEYRTGAKDKWGHALSPRWQLDFNDEQGRVYAGANVVVDGTTGKLLSLNRYSKEPAKDTTFTQAQAQKAAEDFIQKVAPEPFKQTVLTSSTIEGTGSPYTFYNFLYERKTSDGVFVVDDQISVTVHGDGTLTSYTCDWTDTTLPKAEASLSLEKATQAYRDALDLNLSYQYSYRSPLPTVKLVYSNSVADNFMYPANTPALMFDAKTGKALDRFGAPSTPAKLSIAPLDPAGPLEPVQRVNTLTQDEAEALVKTSGLLRANHELGDAAYNESGMKMWSFSLFNKSTKANIGRVALDATTGELINFNTYNNEPAGTSGSAVSDEVVKAKALELVKKLYPGRTGSLAYIATSSVTENFKESSSDAKSVSFAHLKNGIPSPDGIQILFDAQGNVNNFYGHPYSGYDQESQLVYPDPSRAVSLDRAKDSYLKNKPLRLSYYFPMTANGTRSTAPVLVYAPSGDGRYDSFVDGLTGDWISLDPSAQQPSTLPSDIKGHWAESALTQIANLGLLELQDGKAHPDREISRGEFIYLLTNLRGGMASPEQPTFEDVAKDSKYYAAIEDAVVRGWIAKDTKFRPADLLSRQEAATILTRALGHAELAKHSELFALPYADGGEVASWAKGSVAILNGLGVMQGADNRFAPLSDVTLAESCTALLKLQAFNHYPLESK